MAIVGWINSFFDSFSLFCFCSGIFVLFAIEAISVDDPNNPVKSGRSGWMRLEFRVIVPRVPERKKIIIVHILFFLFCVKRNIIVHTKIQPIIF